MMEWDYDTDTFASYLSWRIEFEGQESPNKTFDHLLTPDCQLVRNEIRHQLSQHAVTVRIAGLQEMCQNIGIDREDSELLD